MPYEYYVPTSAVTIPNFTFPWIEYIPDKANAWPGVTLAENRNASPCDAMYASAEEVAAVACEVVPLMPYSIAGRVGGVENCNFNSKEVRLDAVERSRNRRAAWDILSFTHTSHNKKFMGCMNCDVVYYHCWRREVLSLNVADAKKDLRMNTSRTPICKRKTSQPIPFATPN